MHYKQEETIHALKGRYKIRIGDEIFYCEEGGFGYLPSNVPHAFVNLTDEPGEIIVVYTPGGRGNHPALKHSFYARYLAELGFKPKGLEGVAPLPSPGLGDWRSPVGASEWTETQTGERPGAGGWVRADNPYCCQDKSCSRRV